MSRPTLSSIQPDRFLARIEEIHGTARVLCDPGAGPGPQAFFADRSGICRSQVSRMCSGHTPIPWYAVAALDLLEQINDLRAERAEMIHGPLGVLERAAIDAREAAAELATKIETLRELEETIAAAPPLHANGNGNGKVHGRTAAEDREARFARWAGLR